MIPPTSFWWVRYCGSRDCRDNPLGREYRNLYGDRPGVAGPFWSRDDAIDYASTAPAKTRLVETEVGTDKRPRALVW